MLTIEKQLEKIVQKGFADCRFDAVYGVVSLSNRPDLCDYQCNGALKAAKVYGISPMEIAKQVAQVLATTRSAYIEWVEAVPPGFINIKIQSKALATYLNQMAVEDRFGYEGVEPRRKVLVDYGGANVAKALHVGHLRSAVIGESIKRLYAYSGHEVIGDIHLGDWGLQMGLVIEMLRKESPDLIYFSAELATEFPEEPPFDIKGLSTLYTAANVLAKSDESFKEAARVATAALQAGHAGYRALWQHMMAVSKADLKKNYEALNVHFDLWLGESDSQSAIPGLLERFESEGLLSESEGAKVIFVNTPEDNKPMPPCMITNSKGAYLYAITDIATIAQRMETTPYDELIYVVDKRQTLHFEQVFRVARQSMSLPSQTQFTYIGFGTMNGMDGKPFKTRDGGVMALEDLIELLRTTVKEKMAFNELSYSEEELNDISVKVGLAAMKFADLSNQPERDYVFDLNQFVSFDGKTGPYVQYAGVRMASIIKKAQWHDVKGEILPAASPTELELQRLLTQFSEVVLEATAHYAPHKLCEYVFDLGRTFNRFYHETRILEEADPEKRGSWLNLIKLNHQVLSTSLDLLGIHPLEKM